MPMTVATHLQAKCIVSVSIYAGSAGVDGTITWSLIGDIGAKLGVGSFDSIETRLTASGVDVRSSDYPYASNLTDVIEVSGSIRELQTSAGLSVLSQLTIAGQFVKAITLYRPLAATSGGTYRVDVGRISSGNKPIAAGRNVMAVEYDGMGYLSYEGSAVPTLYN